MVENIGDADRFVRLIVGVALVLAGVAGTLGWFWLLVGVALVATAYKRFCPAYKYFGYDSLQDRLRKSS